MLVTLKNMNSGTYKWHIDDRSLVNKILSAQLKDKFDSNVFQVGKLNWKIRLYPNGYSEESKGCCGVFSRLLGMPSSWKSIFCQLHIECAQMQTKMVFPRSYNKPKSAGCDVSSFEDLKASCDKEVTFIITIRITRITLKENIPTPQTNRMLFQMQTNKYKKSARLQWSIDAQMMTKLKSFHKGQAICSGIYDHIWCLRVYPGGAWNDKEGDVVIILYLCALPPNISRMSVQWTAHCHEANIRQTRTCDFDEEHRCHGWNKNTISFSEFSKYDKWTVDVKVNVLHEFDMDGNEMAMKWIESQWMKYRQQNDHALPHPDKELKEKMHTHDVAIASLSTNMQQMQDTLRSLSKAMQDQNHKIEELTQSVSTLSAKIQQMEGTESKEEEPEEEEHATSETNGQIDEKTVNVAVAAAINE
eukprot:181313_1